MRIPSNLFKTGTKVNLPMMLHAREKRSRTQQVLLAELTRKNSGSLLLMTMVVPGPIKANRFLNRTFATVRKEVEQAIGSENIVKTLKREEITGWEFYILSSLAPFEMKKRLVNLEENHPLGRLFDLDVLMRNKNNEVEGLSRTQLKLPVRRCLLCEKPAKACGRSRSHTILELQEEIANRIQTYFEN